MVNKSKIILFILISAVFSLSLSCALKGKPVRPEDLIGTWSTISGYEATEISFSKSNDKQYIFESFLQGRPYESGTWGIKAGDLVIFANGNNTYVYKNIKISGRILTFIENGKTARFSAIKEENPQDNAAQAMLSHLLKNISAQFPEPKSKTFSWRISDEQTVTIKGLQTQANIIVNGDYTYVNSFGDLLEKQGFLSDAYNSSEIISAYIKDRMVFLITINGDPANDQSCSVIIRCGIIPSTL